MWGWEWMGTWNLLNCDKVSLRVKRREQLATFPRYENPAFLGKCEVELAGNLINGAFVRELLIENEGALAKLDVDPAAASAPGHMVALLKSALKNEMEAAEIAASWVESTPETAVKLALARHAGDEARHYELLLAEATRIGMDLSGFEPLNPPSPVLAYLQTLKTSVERVAAALVAREAMGARRNAQFMKFLQANKCDGLVALYRDVINPDEERHHRCGCQLLAKLAASAEDQQRARSAAARLLAIGERMREVFLEKTGATVMPGC